MSQTRARTLRKKMVGKLYRHYKGGFYRVISVDVDEATMEVRVSYQSKKGDTWSRTLDNFIEYVATPTQGLLQRFVQIKDEP